MAFSFEAQGGPAAITDDSLCLVTDELNRGAVAARSTSPRGFTSGKIRTLVKVTDGVSPSPSVTGVMCMMSQEDMCSGEGGEAYFIGADIAAGFTRRIVLGKFTDGMGINPDLGLIAPNYILLAQSPAAAWFNSTVVAVEIEWHVRPNDVNGIQLIGRYGPNFGSLSQFAEVIERGSTALLTTVTEGVCFFKTTGMYTGCVDDTTLISMPILT